MSRRATVGAALCAALAGHCVAAAAEENIQPPTPSDRAYAERLWAALGEARVVGPDSLKTALFKGGGTHTEVLEYFERKTPVAGADLNAVVKKNYTAKNGREATLKSVWNDREAFLMSVTVMLKRPGFDPEHADWFWAEYEPSGAVTYAGVVRHCIACHKAGDKELRFLPMEE